MNKVWTYESGAGQVVLDARKAAFLPATKTLLVADLHFEKGSFLQATGNTALPAYDTAETLERLGSIIVDYQPGHVVALGDSFHDKNAGDRLSNENTDALNRIVQSCAHFTWILGNHDPLIPAKLYGDIEDHLEIEHFLLTHHPEDGESDQTNICGHLHPKKRLSIRRRRIAHPCFACSQRRIILPSFGTYTGGLYTDHHAIESVLDGKPTFALATPEGIYPVG